MKSSSHSQIIPASQRETANRTSKTITILSLCLFLLQSMLLGIFLKITFSKWLDLSDENVSFLYYAEIFLIPMCFILVPLFGIWADQKGYAKTLLIIIIFGSCGLLILENTSNSNLYLSSLGFFLASINSAPQTMLYALLFDNNHQHKLFSVIVISQLVSYIGVAIAFSIPSKLILYFSITASILLAFIIKYITPKTKNAQSAENFSLKKATEGFIRLLTLTRIQSRLFLWSCILFLSGTFNLLITHINHLDKKSMDITDFFYIFGLILILCIHRITFAKYHFLQLGFMMMFISFIPLLYFQNNIGLLTAELLQYTGQAFALTVCLLYLGKSCRRQHICTLFSLVILIYIVMPSIVGIVNDYFPIDNVFILGYSQMLALLLILIVNKRQKGSYSI